MINDKVCPICGGLMIYCDKDYEMFEYKFYLCLHCGNIELEHKKHEA